MEIDIKFTFQIFEHDDLYYKTSICASGYYLNGTVLAGVYHKKFHQVSTCRISLLTLVNGCKLIPFGKEFDRIYNLFEPSEAEHRYKITISETYAPDLLNGIFTATTATEAIDKAREFYAMELSTNPENIEIIDVKEEF